MKFNLYNKQRYKGEINMITAGDFRKGVTFELDGNVYLVVDFLHVKPGKG